MIDRVIDSRAPRVPSAIDAGSLSREAGAAEGSGPWLLVLSHADDPAALPSLDEMRLARPRLPEVHVTGVIDLTPGPGSLRWLRFVRDATALGMAVRWSVRVVGAGVDLSAFTHLRAPELIAGGAPGDLLAAWSAAPDQAFYWRRGPGFAQVRDTRIGRGANRWIIDDVVTLEAFTRAQTPCPRSATPSAILDPLIAEGLVVESGDFVLTVPYRVQRWPIPYTAI
jgi:uncharacterized protein DUF5825